jgi:hypothetical protein
MKLGRLITLLAVAAIAASHLQGQCPVVQYTWSTDGIGPIAMRTCVQVDGKQATFTGTARNDSGQNIRRASWCVLPPKQQDGCAFSLWTTGPFAPGQTLEWNITGPARRGFPEHKVVLSQLLVANKLDAVRKLYVEQIDGVNGPMSRDQLKALVANSHRFELVPDPAKADALLQGRSETRDGGFVFRSSQHSDTLGLAVPIAGTVVAGGNGKTDNQGRRDTIVAESLVLRLVLPSGENAWAWDDTKSCYQAKAACAIEDLAAVANK